MEETPQKVATYVVQEGDTFFKIALMFDISILNLKKQNPGIRELKPNMVLNVTQKHEDIKVHPIDSQLFDKVPPITGTLVLEETKIKFYPREKSVQNCKVTKMDVLEIDLLGFLDSNLTPHPCEFFDDVDEVLPDDCLALLHVSYLAISSDPTSIEIVTFTGLLQELRAFKIAMELKAAKYQNRSHYSRPMLSTFIKPAPKKKKVSHFSLEVFDTIDPSAIITPDQINDVRESLPSRLRKSKWTLLYTLNKDGSSFTQFSKKTKGKENCIILIKTDGGDAIGAYSPAGFGGDREYYSNGESFVFTFFPAYASYKWSKTTQYFISASSEEIAVGGGGGAAIWLDDQFLNGFSEKCNAFNSPPLASSVDFKVIELEIWYVR